MTPEECSVFFKFIIHEQDKIDDFDRASVFKSMSDISGFSSNDRRQAFTDLVLPRLTSFSMKQLNQVLLAYLQKPMLLKPEEVDSLLKRYEECLDDILHDRVEDPALLKTC